MSSEVNNVATYALRLDEKLNEVGFQRLFPQVAEERKMKISGFFRKADAYRSLFAEFLVRYAAIKYFHLAKEEIVFRYAGNGKPYLEGAPHFHFNISHSGDWMVSATGTAPVGIDIEEMAPIEIETASQYFTVQELNSLKEKSGEEQLRFFYELWTLKESYLKHAGGGLAIPLDSFSIAREENGKIILARDGKTDPSVFFKQYNPGEDYAMAACASCEVFEDLRIVSLQELLDFFSAV